MSSIDKQSISLFQNTYLLLLQQNQWSRIDDNLHFYCYLLYYNLIVDDDICNNIYKNMYDDDDVKTKVELLKKILHEEQGNNIQIH